MIVPESDEVTVEALTRGDFGPDVTITLPREHWIVVGVMLEVMGELAEERMRALDAVTPFVAVTAQMREWASFEIRRACGRSVAADARARFGADDA